MKMLGGMMEFFSGHKYVRSDDECNLVFIRKQRQMGPTFETNTHIWQSNQDMSITLKS